MLGIVALVGPAAALAAPDAPSNKPDGQASGRPIQVNGDDVTTGEIVAVGKPTTAGVCDFGAPIEVTITAPGQGQTRWVGIHLDAQCRATVGAKWDGNLTQGPPHVVGPLQRLLGSVTPAVTEQRTQQSSADVASTAGLLASGTKTSEQHVYMYGFGGTWDQLTHKWGTLTFSWDGTNAWIDSQSGSCQGSNPGMGWQWVLDGCWTTGTNSGPAWHVSRSGQGDYHCDPPGSFPCNASNPDGYYHNLFDYENGYGDGTSTCTFGHGGQIVAGTSRDILQGCS